MEACQFGYITVCLRVYTNLCSITLEPGITAGDFPVQGSTLR